MKHKNDLKIKIDKEPRKKENILKRIVIIAILLLIVIFVLNKAEKYAANHGKGAGSDDTLCL